MSATEPARITCDIGGTFTDVVVSDQTGRLTVAKSLTQPGHALRRPARGARARRRAARAAARRAARPHHALHLSTTQATNAILERKTARTAFSAPRASRTSSPSARAASCGPSTTPVPSPSPTCRAAHLRGRRADRRRRARSSTPLDEAAVRAQLAAARAARGRGGRRLPALVDRQPRARAGARRADRGRAAGRPGHALAPAQPDRARVPPRLRAAIDASLKPLMQRHLPEIAEGLRERGLRRRAARGDHRSAASMPMRRRWSTSPIYSVRSGPSLAPVAGRVYADAETGSGDVIVCDTGGTSFDVGLVRGGELVFTRETWLGEPFAGHLTGLSSVDMRSIGAGGGSIAWVDPGGLLRVGPESAGAEPGPACYGRGGEPADRHRRRPWRSATSTPTTSSAAHDARPADAAEAALARPRRGARGRRQGDRRRRCSRSPTSRWSRRSRNHGQRGRRPARQHPGRRRRRRRADDRCRSPASSAASRC